MSKPTPPVAAPTYVRAITAALLGLGVAAMAAPLANGFKVVILIVAVAGALLMTFNHPYRRQVREAVEARGERYSTSWNQVLPLFPLWLALMSLPIIKGNWIFALVVWGIAAAYSWVVHPHLDGTRHIRPMDRD